MKIKITVGTFKFLAKLETATSPITTAEFLKLLPYQQKIIQARWSGESAWIPLGDFKLAVGTENQKDKPAPGEILFYPGGVSETEILFPYGLTSFACKFGPLSGNHFLTITEGKEQLPQLGELVLRGGAQDILFELA